MNEFPEIDPTDMDAVLQHVNKSARYSASTAWDQGYVGDAYKALVQEDTNVVLHRCTRNLHLQAVIEWWGNEVQDVKIVERSAVDRLAELADDEEE